MGLYNFKDGDETLEGSQFPREVLGTKKRDQETRRKRERTRTNRANMVAVKVEALCAHGSGSRLAAWRT